MRTLSDWYIRNSTMSVDLKLKTIDLSKGDFLSLFNMTDSQGQSIVEKLGIVGGTVDYYMEFISYSFELLKNYDKNYLYNDTNGIVSEDPLMLELYEMFKQYVDMKYLGNIDALSYFKYLFDPIHLSQDEMTHITNVVK